MRKNVGLMTIVVVSIVFALMVVQAQAQEGPVSYGGIEFPLGNKSFADKVVDFNPGSGTGEKDGSAVIGPPDGGKGTGPSVIGAKGDVTLGKGGSITLKFTDNYLIDVEGLDLYVFEYGQDVEPFKVEISKDGSGWVDLGTVRGQPTGLDIQGKVAPGDRFSYVRITDANPYAPRDPKTIGTKVYVGADIDAVGAIGAEERPVSNGDGAPGVTELPLPTTGACDWTGTWDTSWGKMELVQTGNAKGGAEVTGTATLILPKRGNLTGSSKPEDGHIAAIVMDNKLAGTWSKYPSYGPPEDAGDIMFIISEDCNSFSGTWRYGYGSGAGKDLKWDGDWTGSRAGPSKPPSKQPSKQIVCASAKPSITEGSEFKRAKFTIGGTVPQEVRVTQSAENFAIKKEYGGVVYQMIDGKSWGSLTLEPGNYILSCNGGGVMGLMSATVCIVYPVVTGTLPAPTPETKVGVSLPPREVVLATMPDGSKLVGMLPAVGPGDYGFSDLLQIMGGITVEVGKTRGCPMYTQFVDGHTEPAYWERAEPGSLANVVSAGIGPDGKRGITHITGTRPGRGWLVKYEYGSVMRATKAPLIVVSATPPPPPKGGEMTIEGKVTYRGNPVPGARISFNHAAGKSFIDDNWKTEADGSFRIVTKKLWVGEYRIRVFKQGTSFGKTMWSKKKKEPKITLLAGTSVSFGPCDIEMETMREKFTATGITIPGGF